MINKGLYYLFGIFLILLFSKSIFAQVKLGYVDSDKIMESWEPAKRAKEKLDQRKKEFQQQYKEMKQKLDSLNEAFSERKMIMSDSRREKKQEEITEYRSKVEQFQLEKLGPEGEIYDLQQELTEPILQDIQSAIQEIGDSEDYDFIFDTVRGNLLYADKSHDLTDKVLEKLKKGEF